MISCKEASYLSSKKLDAKLSVNELLQLFIHICICSLCRRYAHEIKLLHQLLQKAGKTSLSMLPESTRLSIQSQQRIKLALEKAMHETDDGE